MNIVEASTEYSDLYRNYIEECIEGGMSTCYEAATSPAEYLETIVEYAKGKQLPEGWVPITTYFGIENNTILGAIRVRHGTNDYIKKVIGHVGYETRPSARGKGVAQALLKWVIKHHQLANDIILTCAESNTASKKVIEKCGGQLTGSFYDEEDSEMRLYYSLSRTA